MVVTLVASLDDWERKLLDDFNRSFPENEQLSASSEPAGGGDLSCELFESWCWVDKLRTNIGSDLNGSPKARHSSSQDMWALVCRWLSRWQAGYACHSRLSRLQGDNPNLQRQLGDTNFSPAMDNELTIKPHTDDKEFWAIAYRAMHCLRPAYRGLADGESVQDRIQSYIIHNGPPTHSIEVPFARLEINGVLDAGTQIPPAEDLPPDWSGAMPRDDGGRDDGGEDISSDDAGIFAAMMTHLAETLQDDPQQQVLSQSRSDTNMHIASIKSKLKLDDEAPTANEALERILGVLASASLNPPHRRAEDDGPLAKDTAGDGGPGPGTSMEPDDSTTTRSYRLFEIWSLVRMAAMECRRRIRSDTASAGMEPRLAFKFGLSLEDPQMWLEYIPLREMKYSDSISPDCELQWKPNPRPMLDHHLFTEEEVFKYCVEKGFVFPGYQRGDSILFIATDLLSSGHLDLNRLESLWNDCAVTVDPDSGRWYLLETIPGREFRRIESQFGIDAARAHFRRIVDQHRHSPKLQLSDILHNTYKFADAKWLEKHRNLVDAINFNQITLHSETPLGGRNLDVYHARWNFPAKIDVPASSTELDVVLKRVWPPAAGKSEGQLFRELELSLLVSLKRPASLNTLHGLTRAPRDHTLSKIAGEGRQDREEDSVYLIFEYARQTLFTYLDGALRDTGNVWDIIAHGFQDLAESIMTIHGSGIVHRDIHLDNIMVREEPHFQSMTTLSSNRIVLIDLGESRTLDTLISSENVYGDGDFRAPEIRSGAQMGMASDMYSIGRVMFKMLELGLEDGDHDDAASGRRRVPKPLLDVTKGCLEKNPEERLTARELSARLERICSDACVLEDGYGTMRFEEFVELETLGEEEEDDVDEEDSDEE